MIQYFLKKSKISTQEWDHAYQRIESITNSFPLKLVRIESYDGFSSKLDKQHLDLHVGASTPDEHISFYSDRMSFTAGNTVRFYKNWNKQVEYGLKGNEFDKDKPITWRPPKKFKDDGSLPYANGSVICSEYIDTHGALYEYALLSIGIMLENLLPGKFFFIMFDQNSNDIKKVVEWLTRFFQEDFYLPLYFDKSRLLATIIEEYEDKWQVVSRMEELYPKQFKRNIEFAINHIGYEPAFAFYSEVLSTCSFGTFGFSDVLNPWIAVTQDLESTLQLITESKRILLKHKEDESCKKKAEEYDLTYTLKSLLDDFILWDPIQREQLEHFYTNKHALESGQENLFGSMMRMCGYRVDICPIYTDKDELFEEFMYHDPKNGAIYKEIIDAWIENNSDAYENLKQKITEAEYEEVENISLHSNEDDMIYQIEKDNFVQEYSEHERFFIEKAIEANPAYLHLLKTIEDLHIRLWNIYQSKKHQEYVQFIQSESKEKKIRQIRLRLKNLFLLNQEKKYSIILTSH